MPHTRTQLCATPAAAHTAVCRRRGRADDAALVACATAADRPLTPARTFRLALLSGAVAGFTVDAILFPLDTLKTRLQVAAPAGGRSLPALLSGVYAGFGPAVLASAPAAAAFFSVYDSTKRALSDAVARAHAERPDGAARAERLAPLVHVAAAAVGDVAGATVRAPFEVVKQRLQSGVATSGVAAARDIMTTQGPAGFFAGYASLVLRELPFGVLQFPMYEFLKKRAARRRDATVATLRAEEVSVCGSLAGAFAAGLTTPIDVVKTRLMTQTAGASQKYRGFVHCLTTVAKEEGFAGLTSGIAPRIVWMALGGAIFFGAYEQARKTLLPVVAKKEKPRGGRAAAV